MEIDVSATDPVWPNIFAEIMDDILAQHSGESDRREWPGMGTWLYPGDRIVHLSGDTWKRLEELARAAAEE